MYEDRTDRNRMNGKKEKQPQTCPGCGVNTKNLPKHMRGCDEI